MCAEQGGLVETVLVGGVERHFTVRVAARGVGAAVPLVVVPLLVPAADRRRDQGDPGAVPR